jgi:hypothetical protein
MSKRPPTPPPDASVSADLVEAFGADIEAEVEKLEVFADDLTERADIANSIASAILQLARSMRTQAQRARAVRTP